MVTLLNLSNKVKFVSKQHIAYDEMYNSIYYYANVSIILLIILVSGINKIKLNKIKFNYDILYRG